MKRPFLKLMASVALLVSVAAPAIAQESPDALIRRLSTEVLDRIRSDKDLQEGDFIFIKNAGAYTTAYASNFNGFPLPEVAVIGNGNG